jgi:hypothetical protein
MGAGAQLIRRKIVASTGKAVDRRLSATHHVPVAVAPEIDQVVQCAASIVERHHGPTAAARDGATKPDFFSARCADALVACQQSL